MVPPSSKRTQAITAFAVKEDEIRRDACFETPMTDTMMEMKEMMILSKDEEVSWYTSTDSCLSRCQTARAVFTLVHVQ